MNLKMWFTRKRIILLISGVAVVFVVAYVLGVFDAPEVIEEINTADRSVKIENVAALQQGDASLSITGTVKSLQEARIQSEAQGRIVRVNYKLGDSVGAGAVIASIENSAQRAEVLRAQGTYEAALAGLETSGVSVSAAEQSLQEAQVAAINAYTSTFTVADDAVRNKADTYFTGPRTSAPDLTFPSYGSNIVEDIETARVAIEGLLNGWKSNSAALNTDSNLVATLDTGEDVLNTIDIFLRDITTVINRQEPTTAFPQSDIDAANTLILSARTSIDGAQTTISNARNALTGAEFALEQAKIQGSNGSVSSADAQVKQAEGALRAAQAALEKTIIRTPISGTITALPIQTGDFVSAFSPAATVSNDSALEITAFVTEQEATRVTLGDNVIIDGVYEGAVTQISPAINQLTGKVEIRVGVTSDSDLTNGDVVRITIDGLDENAGLIESTQFVLPITALKLTGEGTFVFTVDENNTLVANKVTEGALIGDQIIILEGLTSDMNVVIDARGFTQGDAVILAE